MATTAGGLPYPVGTDKVRDGDNAIKALAEALDARSVTPGSTYGKFRFVNGMYATGTDGRVWIAIPGLTTAAGAVASILGTERWIARPFQTSGGSILFEVHTLAGATVNSIAMTFNITAWGS
jgi:hypothetical protein